MKLLAGLRDLVLLITRVILGGVLVWHGWDKLDNQGIDAVADGFAAMGVPRPELAAQYATYVELVGGAMLILGVLTPLVAALVVGDMGGAFWYAHRDNGLFVDNGGYELVAVIGALALVFVVFGAGRLSLDKMIFGRRRSKDDVDTGAGRGRRRSGDDTSTTATDPTASGTTSTGTTSSYWDDTTTTNRP